MNTILKPNIDRGILNLDGGDINFPLVWDNTMRSDFASCPMQCYLRHFRKLSSSATSIHLHFGGCFAHGLEVFRRCYYTAALEETFHKMEPSLLEAAKAMILFWGDFETDPRDTKTLERCIGLLEAYLQQWPPLTDHIQPHIRSNGQPATEFKFAIPLEVLHPDTKEPLLYCGRFDLLGQYQSSMWVVDEKTTSQLGPTWPAKWGLRSQFIGYVWAAWQHDLEVEGAIVRGCCILKNSFNFAEAIVSTPKWKVERWYEQLCRDLERAIQCWQEGHFDIDYADACDSYGGCQFKRLCEVPNPEPWVSTYYVHSSWNPMA